MKARLVLLILVVLLLVAPLLACGADQREEFHDAPRGARDDSPADVVNMPDGFPNVATKCVNGVRYTVTRRDGKAGVGVDTEPCDSGSGR